MVKRARDGSDEWMDQYVTVALSVRVCSSLLLTNKLIHVFTSPLLNSWVLKKDSQNHRTRDAHVLTSQHHLHNLCITTSIMHTSSAHPHNERHYTSFRCSNGSMILNYLFGTVIRTSMVHTAQFSHTTLPSPPTPNPRKRGLVTICAATCTCSSSKMQKHHG